MPNRNLPKTEKKPKPSLPAKTSWTRFLHSTWLFPAILTVLLLGLTLGKISGSSMGTYYAYFNGSRRDANVLLNSPQSIRSDEWLVNTQMTLAQKNNHFARINHNIGQGEDMSVLADAPYKDWSEVFKPQNLGFFVMPFDFAFAFKWWLMAYIMMLAVYFFTLELLPDRKLFASLLAVFVFFSPFVQWWYLNGTLGCISYCLLSGLLIMKLLQEKRRAQKVVWSSLLVYTLVAFTVLLYPPFQIACALVLAAFVAGYCLEAFRGVKRKVIMQQLTQLAGVAAVAGILIALFIATRLPVVQAIQNTAYPGKRIQLSGGFDLVHTFSDNLQGQLQSPRYAALYRISGNLTNQSEASNFILLLPFLFLPATYLLYKQYRKDHHIRWTLLFVQATFLFLLLWLFVPGLSSLGKITLLSQVPHPRLLIGLGLLNIFQLVLFVRLYTATREHLWRVWWILAYVGMALVVELLLGRATKHSSPGFIGNRRLIAYSLPIPLVLYYLLRKRFELAAAVLALFAISMSIHVNPLYKGTAVISTTPLSSAIRQISSRDVSGVWATEPFLLENFAYMNGAHSLSGVYTYPQLALWQELQPTTPESTYNRYAHSSFAFDRDPNKTIPTALRLLGGDHFTIDTEPCSPFLTHHHVRYLLAGAPLSSGDSCARLLQEISYPAQNFYIYQLQ